MKIKHILVIADQQDKKQSALAQAKHLSEQYQATLHVVAFNYESLATLTSHLNDKKPEDIKLDILTSGQLWLANQISELNLQNHASHDVIWEKDIGSWVSNHCASHSYDLIVKTGHRSESNFYVPTDWHLMRNNLVPTLLVAEKKWRKKQAIMVTVDLGTQVKSKQALNQKLIDAGKSLATNSNMPLHVCYSLPISPVLKDLGIVDAKVALKDAKQKYSPVIKKMLGDDQFNSENIHIKTGVAEKVIPSLASKHNAALVIIGSVGRKGLKAKVLGNTAESVLALLKTDILVIQP